MAQRATPGSEGTARLAEFAQLTAEQALDRLGSCDEGLLSREALDRRATYGPNTIVHEARKGPMRRLLELFFSPLSLLLLVLAGVSFVTGETKGAVVIACIVVMSSLLSFVQEHRSSKAAERLRAMVSTTATVLRKDRRKGVPEEVNRSFEIELHPGGPTREELPIERLVPGEVVVLCAGDMVPADARLLSAKDLFVNEAALTGEAMPVEKVPALNVPAPGNVLELPNICFMGTNVVSGTATALVVATGGETYFGSIAATISEQRELTSFDRGVQRFIWLMIRFILVMVPLVFLINGLLKHDWMEALLFAVAIAVGLTPELLPMIVTINLAKGAIAMSRKKVIVKRLNAIQNFGAMDVLCTDKTGTLTQDKVVLKRCVDILGGESDRVLEYTYLNSHFQTGLKNLLDLAVLEHTELHAQLELQQHYVKVDEIPFDFERRRMSVVVERDHATHVLICKGAVEEILSMCSRAERSGAVSRLDAQHLEPLRGVIKGLNEDGFRVIAVAYKEVPAGQTLYTVADESDLILVGYIAFLDPPKETAKAALEVLRDHGVVVKILTGDNEIVTRKVCRDVGLHIDRVVLGSELDALSDEQLAHTAESAMVFAKLAPQQKARVVKALHLRGRVVGFLGDGINDGPALRAADVGVSVDTAVDIAKESADIILLEKSLLVLDEGVVEGRKVFGNIVKYIKMGASSNFGNMLSVLGASAFLPFLPMAPVQILFNNLLYDFSQTAVATDNVDPEYVERPRKWDIGNIGRFMLFIGPISSAFDYVTFFTLLHFFGAWTNEALFQTGWFVESLVSQTLIVHVIRTGKIPFLESQASPALLGTTLGICLLGLWLPVSHFAPALNLVALPHQYLLALLLILVGYMTVTQLMKAWLIRRFGLS
ncbi:MAG TPA: magnesium-translocating P-type ATPase [Burkholderiales bacterium]|nr:magnesium-translocating P-type ATPase [Burkholderiales bacterium]